MTPPTFERVRAFLASHGVPFMTLHHEAARTSADSAAARGETLDIGAKALVVKVDEGFALFVLSAARRLDAGKIRAHLGVKKIRFATPEELKARTGLAPGAVPPFGRPLLDLDLFVDTSLAHLDRIAFNAASHTDSITMQSADYLRIADAEVFDFAGEG